MASLPVNRSTSSVYLLIFYFLTLTANPISSFALQTLTNNPNFDPEVSLFGDADIVNGGSHVQLTHPFASSSGLLLCRTPFKFLDGNLSQPTSFSTEFSFSISPGNGDGLALVIVPFNFPEMFPGEGAFALLGENRFLGIEFDTSMDSNVGDLNANHVGIDAGSLVSISVSNVASIDLVLNSGEKLKSWIDYNASSKKLEVRLDKLGKARPVNPILSHHVDLLKMWGDNDVVVGISSTNGNSSQTSSVYSWRFRLRNVHNRMHSLPADPHAYSDKHGESLSVHKKRICPLSILAGLIFATGCGALLAFVVLFMWVIFVSRHTVFPAESQLTPVNFRYEKIDVVVDEDAKGVNN